MPVWMFSGGEGDIWPTSPGGGMRWAQRARVGARERGTTHVTDAAAGHAQAAALASRAGVIETPFGPLPQAGGGWAHSARFTGTSTHTHPLHLRLSTRVHQMLLNSPIHRCIKTRPIGLLYWNKEKLMITCSWQWF